MTSPAGKKSLDAMLTLFKAAVERQQKLVAILSLSSGGIGIQQMRPMIMSHLVDGKWENGEYEKRLKEAERDAALASAEVEADFPNLHGFGVLALWGWLEAFAFDWAVLWVEHNPTALDGANPVRIRVSLADFMSMPKRERARAVVEHIDQEISGPLKHGAGRFLALWDRVGTRISLNDEQRRDLFEFQQVRNCLAHRFGIVDARLKSSCPWLNLSVGDELRVSRPMMFKYLDGAAGLLLNAILAAGDYYGEDLRPTDDELSAPKNAGPSTNTINLNPSADKP